MECLGLSLGEAGWYHVPLSEAENMLMVISSLLGL